MRSEQWRVRRITALLKKAYGKPPALRKTDPVDEIIRTVLSQNTSDKNSLKAFAVLKARFGSWEGLVRADTAKVAGLIRHAGLANIKARRIKGILREIKKREGGIDLSLLKDLRTSEALAYLRSLKGVGPKTAACVLLFSFGKPTMPVDTHIYRVTGRLGLITKDTNIEEAHEKLSLLVPRNLIYDFHLCIIEHGRRTCKAHGPRCGACAIYGLCKFERKTFFKKRLSGDKKSKRL